MTEENQKEAFEQVYNKIYSLLNYSPNGESEQSNKIIQLGLNMPINPEQYQGMLEPGVPGGDLSKSRAFSLLVDQIPSIGSVGGSTGQNLGKVYYDVINNANTTDQSTEEQIKRYNEARKLLFDDTKTIKNPDYDPEDVESSETITIIETTDKYKAYLSAKAQYDAAMANYYSKYTSDLSKTAAGQGTLRKLQDKIDYAYNNLELAGAAEIRNALNVMATAMNLGLSSVIAEQKRLLNNSAFQSEDKVKWFASYPIPSAYTWSEVGSRAKRDQEISDYRSEQEKIINEIKIQLEQARNDLKNAKEKGDSTDKYEVKIDKLEEKLEKQLDTLNNKIEKIMDKYQDKIDNEKSFFSEFEFSSKEKNESKHSSSHNGKAGFSFNWNIFSSKGKGGAKSSTTEISRDNADIIIKGELATVQIIRPWFDPTIFKLNGWTNSLYGKNKLSTGDPNDANSILPMYTTALILMKNLSLEATFSNSESKQKTLNGAGGGGFSFGPFTFGGGYSGSKEDSTLTETENGFKITNKGIQIIGYVNEIVPACPSADDPSVNNK